MTTIMQLSNQKYNPKPGQSLEDWLKELAMFDWKTFIEVTGIDLKFLKVCEMRAKGKSWGQISKSLDIPKSSIRSMCKKCA